jgi:lipoprotein-anchoring transpeptidase ErfK/SrfK
VADEPRESEGQSGDVTYAWAPTAEPRRKRHLGLWIGTPTAIALVGVVAASLVLIAPGTAVAGVQVGGMTAGAAAAAIQEHLDNTTITLTGDGVDATLTGAQLGATVDAKTLAETAYGEHPMWNIGAWNSGALHAPVELDAAKATEALRDVAPDMFADATDATVRFDETSAKYVTTAAADGVTADLKTVTDALQTAFTAGSATVSTDATVAAKPAIPTSAAKATADKLNAMLSKIGFYVGDERTVPVSRSVAASWLTVAPGEDGLTVTADQAAIQKTVDGLAKKVDRKPQNGTSITDTQGKVLRVETETLDGRTLGDTAGIAAAFAAQLEKGDGVYKLTVDSTPGKMTKVSRSAVVDLSEQRAYFYQNGKLWNSYLVSTGDAKHATPTGYFRVFAHVGMQDMGCYPGAEYCTKNVPWVTYFAPNIGFHGTYWHSNFGHVMSHGCVNMPIDIARTVYNWSPEGMEVTVRR